MRVIVAHTPNGIDDMSKSKLEQSRKILVEYMCNLAEDIPALQRSGMPEYMLEASDLMREINPGLEAAPIILAGEAGKMIMRNRYRIVDKLINSTGED